MFDINKFLRSHISLPLDLPTPQYADLPCGPMEYVVYGEGTPILILHGGVGGYDQSLVLFRDCIPDNYQLICPSRPGYLGTPLSTGRSIDEQADAIVELLEHLGISQIAMVGMSAGGMILYSLAIRYPQFVKSIIAIDAIAGQYLLPEQASKWAQSFFMTDFGLWFTRESLIYFPEMTIKKFINSSGSVNQELVDRKAKEIMSNQQEMRLISEIMYLITDYHNRESGTMNDLHNGSKINWFDFGKIQAPALIIHGTHDNEVRFYHGVFAYEGLGSSVKQKEWIEYGAHFGFYFKTQCGNAQNRFHEFLALYS